MAAKKGKGKKTKSPNKNKTKLFPTPSQLKGSAKAVREGSASIEICDGVFFNPEMEFCRDVSSLAVGAIGEKIDVCDAFCASGVRGIRYEKENDNVSSVTFVDLSQKAMKCARKNAKRNKMKKANFVRDDINRFLYANPAFDFIELDPFGSPAPYIYDAVRCFSRLKKTGYLSLTATDMAVLCGAHPSACLKNYGAKPLDNEFCHENAMRILLGKLALVSAEFGYGISPLFCISRQHFLKLVVKLERSAEKAVQCVRTLGYASWCSKCCYREQGKFPKHEKCECGNAFENAGPMWLGEIGNAEFVDRMALLNSSRDYRNKHELLALLELLKSDILLPAFYYNLHGIAKRMKASAPRQLAVLAALRAKGFKAELTHFAFNSIKTDAPLIEIRSAITKAGAKNKTNERVH